MAQFVWQEEGANPRCIHLRVDTWPNRANQLSILCASGSGLVARRNRFRPPDVRWALESNGARP
jgi:hypothetical protein